MQFATKVVLQDLARTLSFHSRTSERGQHFLIVSAGHTFGAGYRVLGRVGLGYANLSKLPKRLLIHHPRSNIGKPWLFWLSAGRTGLVPPTVLGLLQTASLKLMVGHWTHLSITDLTGNVRG